MIRRPMFYTERDHRVVKWSLIAATFALSLGCLAETKLATRDVETSTAVAGQTVELPSADAASVTG